MILLKQFPRFLFVLVGDATRIRCIVTSIQPWSFAVSLQTKYAPNGSISCIKKYLQILAKSRLQTMQT
eukprot:CCRYP_008125-RA/>CCRYP_008125-RA protein AED:0.32 eAED:0.84 QI:0/0/0/1/0/0/2/0/67